MLVYPPAPTPARRTKAATVQFNIRTYFIATGGFLTMLSWDVLDEKAKLYPMHGIMYVPKDVVKAPKTPLMAPKKGKATAKNNIAPQRGNRAKARATKGLSWM